MSSLEQKEQKMNVLKEPWLGKKGVKPTGEEYNLMQCWMQFLE